MKALRLKSIIKTANTYRFLSVCHLITRYIKINHLLIFLFAYTAVSKLNLFSYNGERLKLVDVSAFKDAMYKSIVLRPYVHELAWLIPLTEIAICMLLLFDKTKKWGLYLSFFILSIFTSYIIYILNAYPTHLPCVCGGVISLLSWSQHLVFNFIFVLLTLRGIYLMHRLTRK